MRNETKYRFTVRMVQKCGMEIYVGMLTYEGTMIHYTEAMSEVGCRRQILKFHQKLSQKQIQESFLTA